MPVLRVAIKAHHPDVEKAEPGNLVPSLSKIKGSRDRTVSEASMRLRANPRRVSDRRHCDAQCAETPSLGPRTKLGPAELRSR